MLRDEDVIGWREWVSFPDLGIPAIKAKIDTGAKTSALHTFDMETFTNSDGVEMVRFSIHPLRRQPDVVRTCEAPVYDRRIVKDSGGHQENRISIRSVVRLGGHNIVTPITLTNREDMLFRLLVGRRTISEGKLLVNSNASYLAGRIRRKQLPDYYKELATKSASKGAKQ